MFENKTVLITGGTGSWGRELTKKLLSYKPKEIRIFSRNEFAQVEMQRTINHATLKFIIGDVRDYNSVYNACKKVDYIFHLAALKHVPICEAQPLEALKTNVIGTENIIRASIKNKVVKVINVSTDKAVDPVNIYGLTKALAERLIINSNLNSNSTRFVCIRAGNVLGTNGSVVPLFKQQIKEGNEVTLTSKEMTRFFLTITDTIDLLLKAALESVGGEIFVMNMKACRILDLAEVLIKNFSEKPVNINEIGIRIGEKIHEILISDYESFFTYRYDELYYVILSQKPSTELLDKYSGLPQYKKFGYSSNDNLMSSSDIEKLLNCGGLMN
ncbi:polysaccharide biosynthesis protein [Fictibacillus fluitans]|uniref:Polysaccharide biosynthesis protein n=1 Tax=Fictibacillus fluitans TaxID=3058422 RepID=A0ABT8HSA1_9BACL|nr:polysaccharide biosynthesis protein [Fictibacillus sp. NE201]MDN4523631.1 polysaccharide biosynthesis protein [Fictibacillus sp. NE201]